jgi:hypothetical protein
MLTVVPSTAPWAPQHAARNLNDILPPLHLPPDATLVTGGGGSSGSNASVQSAMTIQTDLDQRALAAFLVPQLAAAGWRQQNAGAAGALVWSTWLFADDAGAPWQGTLYVLQCPERARQYKLSLEGEWTG